MSTFLQTNTGDWDFSAHNWTVVTELAPCVGQKLNNRFNFWEGTWYQDVRQGFPYLQNILGVMSPNMGVIGQVFRRALLQTPGVDTVLSASLDFIKNTRQLSAIFSVKCTTGEVLTGGVGSPFIVTLAGSGQS